MTEFQCLVYEIVRLIPKGSVSTYGAIAKALGTAKSSRMVGYAMNNAQNIPDIPAHRVVNRNGVLTGKHHFIGQKSMEELLNEEGILVKNDQIINFKEVFWDPMEKLSL